MSNYIWLLAGHSLPILLVQPPTHINASISNPDKWLNSLNYIHSLRRIHFLLGKPILPLHNNSGLICIYWGLYE